MAVGLAGNIRYADHVKAQLSLNFDTDGGWSNAENLPNRIAIVLYCFQLIPTYAVVYFCAYEAVENKMLRAWNRRKSPLRKRPALPWCARRRPRLRTRN